MNNLQKTKTRAIILYNIFFIIAAIGFYFLIPIVLNYPPNSINNEFEKTIDAGIQYIIQYSIIMVVTIIISNIYFLKQIKDVEKYKLYIDKEDTKSKIEIEKIRRKCFNIPYKIYILYALLPNILIFIIMLGAETDLMLVSKILLLIFSFTLVLGIISYIFAKNIMNNILTELKNREKYVGKFKVNYRGKVFVLFIPLLFVTILFPLIMADTLLARERGNFIYENYYNQLSKCDLESIKTIQDGIEVLNNISKHLERDSLFIITEDEIVYTDNNMKISDFFRKYTFSIAENGHTYGYYASGIQGTFKFININNTKYAIGIMYETDSSNCYISLICTMLSLITMCMFFLIYFSKEMSYSIKEVSKNMRKIANEEVIDYNQKLPVISNDELGDLVISFNKILDLEKRHSIEMQKNQEILVEQERLSSLGQLIGGMAHNLKTPIMSIAGASQALKELISEYDKSISNKSVTEEDYHDIAKDMNEWNDKIKVYLEYMTEVINAAKGQAVSMNASTVKDFSMEELVARVQILMKEQLLNRGCTLNLNFSTNKDTCVKGELSAIVQVIDNLIMNAIDAYEKKSGEINFKLYEDEEKVYMEIEDFAGGIPKDVQEKLFRQMITTKGKDGTGLGLYMCYSTIKGKFNGELTFKTEIGKGTKFLIELNKEK